MGGICFCGCGCQSDNPFVFWLETHTKSLRARSPTRPEEEKGRKVPEISWQRRAEEESRQERSVKRKTQSAEGSTRDSRHERAVKRRRTQSAKGSTRDQSTEQVSREMRVGQRGNQSTKVSIVSGFVRVFARLHAHVSSQDAQKVSQTSHSCAWS